MLKLLILSCLSLSLLGCGDSSPFGEPRTTRVIPPTVPPEEPKSDQPLPLKCGVECKIGEETSNCLLLNRSVSRPEYMERVARIPDMFESSGPNSTIVKSDLMSLFDSPEDPCERSGLDVGEGYAFSNFGGYCNITYPSVLGDISLLLPPTIQGKYTKNTEGFVLRFPNSSNRLKLRFKVDTLQIDYGGEIDEIAIIGTRTIVKTSTACIAARL